MAKNVYKGYSSFEFQKNKTFRLNDVEIVKLDLLNHIFTRRGERVMMPNFGTSIPDMVFEPLDDETISIIEDELWVVFNYDPRVTVNYLNVTPSYDENTLTVNVELYYVELNIVDTMDLNIEFETA